MNRYSQMVFIFILMVALHSTIAIAGITKGPILLDVNDSGVTVAWETGDSSGVIHYGDTETNLDQSVDVSGNDNGMLRGQIEGLNPGTVCFYQVSSGGQDSAVLSFTTAPSADAPFYFVAFGDVRTNQDDHAQVVAAIIGEAPDFVLQSGDLVEVALSGAQWNEFFAVELPLMGNTPYFPVMGNHEEFGGAPTFQKYFNTPAHNGNNVARFAFQYGNTYFINLDITLAYGVGSDQYAWFQEQLDLAAQMPGLKHCIVQVHFTTYSAAKHGNDLDVKQFRNAYAPLFEQYGVDLVVSGHDHTYQHNLVNNIHYLCAGGGGAPLYNVDPESWTIVAEKTLNYARIDVEGDTINVTGKRPDGTVIENFQIVHDFGIPDDDDTVDDDTSDDDAADDDAADDDATDDDATDDDAADNDNVDDDATDDDSGDDDDDGCGC